MTDLTIDGGRGLVKDEGRIGDWSQTYTGKRFYPRDPRVEDIDLIDIAVALSNISRYGGHCSFYSVAEHSVLVSHMVRPEHRLTALLHDAAEAYIQDLTRPNKRALRDMGQFDGYAELDRRVQEVIHAKFGLPPGIPSEVIEADTTICALEREVLHPRADPWDLPPTPEGLSIRCAAPVAARRIWLIKVCRLTKQQPSAFLARLCVLERENAERQHEHLVASARKLTLFSNYDGKGF